MMTNDIHPPRSGLNSDPVLYGVAAGLAELFPLATAKQTRSARRDREADDGAEREADERD